MRRHAHDARALAHPRGRAHRHRRARRDRRAVLSTATATDPLGAASDARVRDVVDPVAALLARRPGTRGTGRSRSAALCAALGEPQRGLRAVHVTGTNGKSSTAWLTAALLRAEGWRTGSYTSPHLDDITERIRVDGAPLPIDALRRLLDDAAPAVAALDAAGAGLGFFDVLTPLAFAALTAAEVDVAVVEVGRGGRDDATNVLDAPVVVLGPVALDHAELGATPEAVARAKLGLLRPGATLVTARQPRAVAAVAAQAARRLGARLVRVGHEVDVEVLGTGPWGQDVVVRSTSAAHRVRLAAHGAHQAENLALALAAAEAWAARPLTAAAVATAASVPLPGRLEPSPLPGGATLLLDGAHNPAAAAVLARALPDVLAGRRCVLVLGCAGEKDLHGVAALLAGAVDEVVATATPGARSADARAVARAVADAGGRGCTVVADPAAAVREAATRAGPAGVVLVTGSLHLVGAVRPTTRRGGTA